MVLLTALACTASALADGLTQKIDSALADPRLRGAKVAVEVRALGTGRVLYSKNASEKLILASNEKLLVAATALGELGPRYEFTTQLMSVSPDALRGHALSGGLVLRGGADPTLGSPSAGEEPLQQFGEWADKLLAMGVERIEGDLIVDDSFLDPVRIHPDWPDSQLWRSYYAPVSALSLNDNCVSVEVKPGAAAGSPAVLTMSPEVPFLKFANRCKTSAKKHSIWFSRESGGLIITVGGYVKLGTQGYTGSVTVPHPALFSGAVLAGVLDEKGIRLEGTVRLAGGEDLAGRRDWRVLAERRTPIARVLSVMLKDSQNMYAEHVIKAVGAHASGGEGGSWEAGLARTAAMLRAYHFRPDSFSLADGSGLSRDNRASAQALCEVLVEMDRSEAGRELRGMLSVAGVDGTLRRRLRTAPYKGNVEGKTGYLRGVGALSGYARTRSGVRVAFSILINDFKPAGNNSAMKQIEDSLARAIVDAAQ